jgi:antitoxin YefM
MDRVCKDCSPLRITRGNKRRSVVMPSLEEYGQLQETAHLIRSPVNAKRLSEAIDELSRGLG